MGIVRMRLGAEASDEASGRKPWSLNRGAWLGWATCAVSALLFTLALLMAWANDHSLFLGFLSFVLGFLAFPAVGTFIVARQPGNSIGWIFCAVGLLIGFWIFAGQYAVFSLVTAPGSLPGGVWLAWLGAWAGEPGWGLITTFLPLLFPTGRLLSRRWRGVAWAVGIIIALQIASDVTKPGPLQLQSFGGKVPPQQNPTGIAALAGVADIISNTLSLLFVALAVVCLLSVVLRYRRAKGEERAQIRWFAYAAVLVPVVFSIFEPFGSLQQIVGTVVFALAIAAFPSAVGIAVLRYRLWAIDNLINRTLVYGILTAMLVALYLGSVVLFELVLRPVVGERNEPAIVISTLAIAALFNPLRTRIQTFIDRRFYRRKYDVARTLASLGAAVRDEVDLTMLSSRLLEVVEDTMRPAHASLWLRKPEPHAHAKE